MKAAAKAKVMSENEFYSEHEDSDETKLVWGVYASGKD